MKRKNRKNPKPTARESEVAELILEGMNVRDIAQQLHISKSTAVHHRCRLYFKYGITSGVKCVKLAMMLYRERNPQ